MRYAGEGVGGREGLASSANIVQYYQQSNGAIQIEIKHNTY